MAEMNSRQEAARLAKEINDRQESASDEDKLICNNDNCWSSLEATVYRGNLVLVCTECRAIMPDSFIERAINGLG